MRIGVVAGVAAPGLACSVFGAATAAPAVSGYDLLTEREQQVFRLVAQGHSSAQIGDVLCISQKTVEKHRASLMNKLHIHDRFELLKYAIKIGVVDPDLWEDYHG